MFKVAGDYNPYAAQCQSSTSEARCKPMSCGAIGISASLVNYDGEVFFYLRVTADVSAELDDTSAGRG